jgi:hypothetical protein
LALHCFAKCYLHARPAQRHYLKHNVKHNVPADTDCTWSTHLLRTGKWNKHVDAWDAIQDNEFFSIEGFIFAFSQMFQVQSSPLCCALPILPACR